MMEEYYEDKLIDFLRAELKTTDEDVSDIYEYLFNQNRDMKESEYIFITSTIALNKKVGIQEIFSILDSSKENK